MGQTGLQLAPDTEKLFHMMRRRENVFITAEAGQAPLLYNPEL